MYFNGKTYFNQEQNMRVLKDQRNPPPRRKGIKKKKGKKKGKGGKVDMKKLKSLFGNDIIVKLLLSLVDKKSQGPNLKKEGKKSKMKRARGNTFQTGKQVKSEREKRERQERVAKAAVKKPGETDEDVSLRMMKEVIAGDNPAVAAFLQANKIPPELRRLQGNLVVLGEAYFDKKTTAKDKKAIERNIVRQVIDGIGGEVRKDFLTSVEELEATAGIKEAVELLKKETGIKDPEKIIQQQEKITKEIKKKVAKGKLTEEQADKILDGIDVVEELKTTDTQNIETVITDANISNIQAKKKAGGRKKQSPDEVKKDLLDYMEVLNPSLQTPDSENRKYFVDYIDTQIGEGKNKTQIKNLINTQNKRLLSGKLSKQQTEQAVEKKTRADAGIFLEGAIANNPYAYNIKIGATGETRKFDLLEQNGRARYLKNEIDKYNRREESDVDSSNYKKLSKELEGHFQEFRNQLKSKAEGKDYNLRPDYTRQTFTPDEIAEDINDLIEDFKQKGIGLPTFKFYKGEQLYAIGDKGLTLRNPTENTYRYIDYDQKEYKKELQKQAKEDKRLQKILRDAGSTSGASATDRNELDDLIDALPDGLNIKYRQGALTGTDQDRLSPRLKIAYSDYLKEYKKLIRAQEKSGEASQALVPAGATEPVEQKPGFFSKVFGKKEYKPRITREATSLGFTTTGEEITDQSLSKSAIAIREQGKGKLSQAEIDKLSYDEQQKYKEYLKKKEEEVSAGFDTFFSAVETSQKQGGGDLLQEKPKQKSQLYLEDFDSPEAYQEYLSQQPQFVGEGQFEGQYVELSSGAATRPEDRDVIAKREKEEKKKLKEEQTQLIKDFKDGRELIGSDVAKLTRLQREKIGLLNDKEYSELTKAKREKYDKIKATVEDVASVRLDTSSQGFLGSQRIPKEQLQLLKQLAIKEPEVESITPLPPPAPPPSPDISGGEEPVVPPRDITPKKTKSSNKTSRIDQLIQQGYSNKREKTEEQEIEEAQLLQEAYGPVVDEGGAAGSEEELEYLLEE